jgi:two-component system sensor histidine kinase CiaH
MFESARLKLTAWYLLIIMAISIFFSAAIYSAATSEVERVINRVQFRQEHPNVDIPDKPPSIDHNKPSLHDSLEDLEKARQTLLVTLLFINGTIFVLAGGAGYFLAGRTLRPIKVMIDEQNQFISSASHELRTPIATMRAEMEGSLLEKSISDREARSLLKSSLEELGELQDLSNKLLQIAQVHSVQNGLVTSAISLKKVLQTAEKKVIPLAKKKHIMLSVNVLDVEILGDQKSLTEVFVILLDNAIKYSPEKSNIKISLEAATNSVSVFVEDQGVGIAAEDLPHIFDRFYRADKSRNQDGFGLGLSIAKKIVEKHKGSLMVKSKDEKGTTFIVQLPLI